MPAARPEGGHDHDEAEALALLPGPGELDMLNQNETTSFQFDDRGSFMYHCHPHEVLGMEGMITVTEEPGPLTLSDPVHIHMTDYLFEEPQIEILEHTTVTWHNHETTGHNVVLTAPSEEVAEEEAWSFSPLQFILGGVILLLVLGAIFFIRS